MSQGVNVIHSNQNNKSQSEKLHFCRKKKNNLLSRFSFGLLSLNEPFKLNKNFPDLKFVEFNFVRSASDNSESLIFPNSNMGNGYQQGTTKVFGKFLDH